LSTWRRRTKFCRSKNSEFRSTFASKTIFSWRFFRARRAETPQARRASERAVLETPARLRRFARGGVTLPCARREARGVPPRTGALPRAVGASQAHRAGRTGGTNHLRHDVARQGTRESFEDALLLFFTRCEARANARGDERARTVSAPARRRVRGGAPTIPRSDARRDKTGRGRSAFRVARARTLESASFPARSRAFLRDAERAETSRPRRTNPRRVSRPEATDASTDLSRRLRVGLGRNASSLHVRCVTIRMPSKSSSTPP